MVIPREELKIMKNILNKRLTELDKAYLAGFLDGDGAIVSQIVQDKGRKYKFYIRISVCFYQSAQNHWYILWLKKKLKPSLRIYKGSYVRKRNNGTMSDLTIVAKEPVKELLKTLYPYLVLKKTLCRLILSIIDDLEAVRTEADFLKVCKKVDKTAELTYSKNRKITYAYVKNYLNSPVETS